MVEARRLNRTDVLSQEGHVDVLMVSSNVSSPLHLFSHWPPNPFESNSKSYEAMRNAYPPYKSYKSCVVLLRPFPGQLFYFRFSNRFIFSQLNHSSCFQIPNSCALLILHRSITPPFLQHLVHCADLSNPTKPLPLYRRFSSNPI